MKNLDSIFNPKTIAVIGANNKKGKVGYGIFKNLSGFKGKVYPVNPNQKKIQGVKSYPVVNQIKEKIDLAIIAVKAKITPKVVEQCGKKGVKACIVISSGFGETGEKGKKLEKKLGQIIKKYNMRMIGPNCLGIIKTANNLNASFATKMPKKGKTAVLSQSGALGSAIIEWSLEQNIGIGIFASVGSMLDINFADLIEYFGKKPDITGIIIYMESVKNAKRFMETAKKAALKKPIVVLKAGVTPAGKKAATSHTGALAGNEKVYEAAFRQSGILQIKETDDIFTCLRTLNNRKLPKGPKLAIVTNAGGGGVMAVDALTKKGGELAKLSKKTISELSKNLPPICSYSNPIDILGDADHKRYETAVKTCIEDTNVDGVLVIFTPQYSSNSSRTAHVLVKMAKKYTKPIFASWIGPKGMNKASLILSKGGVPNYSTPEEAVGAFVNMWNYKKNLELLKVPKSKLKDLKPNKNNLRKIIKENPGKLLSEIESKKFLQEYGIPTVKTYFANNPNEAAEKAQKIGFPVALKIQSPDIVHKTEAGGVLLNLDSKKEVREGFNKIAQAIKNYKPKATFQGVSVQKMAGQIDYELILGAKREPDFGPVVIFGNGGIEVEIYNDISIGIPPFNKPLAKKLITETKISKFLKNGFRGRSPVDIEKLSTILERFSQLVLDFPEIKEIDVNPLAIQKGKPLVLDARIILNKV